MPKNLIVYFSHAGQNWFDGGLKEIKVGNTKVLAEKLSKILEADLFEVETIKTYPFDYRECCDEAQKEQRANELPELKKYLDGIDEYDNIILAYPCWWGTMPQAMFTFLNHYDFNGKNIYPICTHEGSGMGNSENDIKKVCSTAIVHNGLAVRGSTVYECEDKLNNFAKNI